MIYQYNIFIFAAELPTLKYDITAYYSTAKLYNCFGISQKYL